MVNNLEGPSPKIKYMALDNLLHLKERPFVEYGVTVSCKEHLTNDLNALLLMS